MITIKITRLRDDVSLPAYQTAGSAAVDLSAAIDEEIVLEPLERKVIPTGITIALPQGYEAQIRARSGLSLKQGLAMANGIGTIDSDYRGEIGVIAINLSNEPLTVTPGMRIAQMVVAKYEVVEWEEVAELDETERSSGGYGSTGH